MTNEERLLLMGLAASMIGFLQAIENFPLAPPKAAKEARLMRSTLAGLLHNIDNQLRSEDAKRTTGH